MVALSGIGGEQAPILTLSDNELYFGTVESGTTVDREVIIYNEGVVDLEIEEVTISGSDYYTTTFSDASVEPGDSVIVPFSFAPTEQVAEVMATATVASNVGTQTIELKAGYFGPVWHVATTGSDETGDGTEEYPFATIQYGIDNISEHDSLFVHSGNYFENIIINEKSICIIGEDRETTIINGGDDGKVVQFLSIPDSVNVASIQGFTIKNGYDLNDGGAGILVDYSFLNISDVTITENYGVGVRAWLSNIIINNSLISSNNNEWGGGGGLYISSGSHKIINTNIVENTSSNGAGIKLNSSCHVELENVEILNNVSMGDGGGVASEGSSIEFNGGKISNNTADNGGGQFNMVFKTNINKLFFQMLMIIFLIMLVPSRLMLKVKI